VLKFAESNSKLSVKICWLLSCVICHVVNVKSIDCYGASDIFCACELSDCDITPSQLETLASDRTDWWSMCKSVIRDFGARRVYELRENIISENRGPLSTSNFQCQICWRMCRSHIGLTANATHDDKTHCVDGAVHERYCHLTYSVHVIWLSCIVNRFCLRYKSMTISLVRSSTASSFWQTCHTTSCCVSLNLLHSTVCI